MISRNRQWQRQLGGSLMVAGTVLLAMWAVPTVYGSAMSRLAVREFRAENGSHALWDGARILAYQRSLGVELPPPEAVLRVPKIGLEVPVLEGTSELALNRGAGHIAGTAEPGQAGNVGIAGHRDGFFRGLKELVLGDFVELDRPGAQSADRYVVRSIRIVAPADTSSLKATAGSMLTLVTCYPFHYVGAAPQRYVVQAALVSHNDFKATSTTPGD